MAIAGPALPREEWRNAEGHNRRCQARGGPRARKESDDAAARSRPGLAEKATGLKTTGSSKAGAMAGVAVAAKWIRVQMAQKSPACPLGSSFEGGLAASEADAEAASANSGVVALPSRCTCPNDSTSWAPSANSAHHAPNRTFERIQRIAFGPFRRPKLAPLPPKSVTL